MKKPALTLNSDTDFIKLTAAAAMLCDHFSKIIAPDMIFLQIIGRIAFPIFAYCIAAGAVYTKDIKAYMLRLIVLAVLTQPVYIQAFVPGCVDLLVYIRFKNVLFSLFCGLTGIYGIKERKWYIFAFAAAAALFIKLDYGFYGFVMIIGFYLLRENAAYSFFFITMLMLTRIFLSSKIEMFGVSFGINAFQVLSLPFIYTNTNTRVKVNKYFFYLFYPLHLLALYAARFALL